MAIKLFLIIRHYQQFKANYPDTWKNDCQGQHNLEDAITLAASCKDSTGKKHPHQFRLKNAVLLNLERQLLNSIAAIRLCANFDALYRYILANKPPGVGPLCSYDVAVRIGAYLGYEPLNIYLHAGTRIGLEKLIGRVNSDVIPKAFLPNALRNSNLTCYELEDLLCIYKNRF
jgi:hypothetical protein